MTDQEVKAKSEVAFNSTNLLSKNHTIDSLVYGSDSGGLPCSICNGIDECQLHSGYISIPFPIVKAICIKDFRMIVPLICPVCGKIPLQKTIKEKIMLLKPYDRISFIKSEIEKLTNKGEKNVMCSECKNNVRLISVINNEPQLMFVIYDKSDTNDFIQLNPIAVYTLLQLFNELDLVGFSSDYHPKDFMTTVIPITPNKLRLKSFDSSVSTISSYYTVIIKEIIPELDKIYKSLSSADNIKLQKGDTQIKFNIYYDKLNAYYMLLMDTTTKKVLETCLNLIDKKDRKHVDKNNSSIGRLKDKDRSLFAAGVNESRHDCSARTVLGGAPDSKIIQVNMPHHIASKLTIWYPVYEQNIKAMQQLVASMSDPSIFNDVTIPHALFVFDNYTQRRTKIEPKNAQTKASLLKSGDKISISLMDGDFVMQSRFPSMREESWTSLQVKRDFNSIISIPLAITKMKTADFDGDEAQVYCSYNSCFSIEALLLHSCYRQLIAHKDGYLAILLSEADIPVGMKKIKQGKTRIIKNWDVQYPPTNIINEIENLLPKDLSYSDESLEIKNGKIIGNKTDFGNKEFYKYFSTLYGNKRCVDFMDEIIQICYDLNRNDGDTLGFTIKIYGDDNKKQIQKMKDDLYERMKIIEQQNNPNKDIYQIVEAEKIKPEIQAILIESAKNTEISSFATSKTSEYYDMVVELGQLLNQGERMETSVAEGQRANCAFPRFSTDPCAYGFVKRAYCEDPGPIDHMYDCKSQRIQLYTKGQQTRKQGYLQKKLCMAYGTTFANFNGMVVDAFRIIEIQYGAFGADPRLSVVQPLIDINLEERDWLAKYEEQSELKDCYYRLKEYIERYTTQTNEVRTAIKSNIFSSSFNWEQLINNNLSEGKTSIKDIDLFIEDLKNIYVPKGLINLDKRWGDILFLNLTTHIYYFRAKFINYKLDEKMHLKILKIFTKSLIQGGEPVGIKAAISASEPLTQASLHAIHSHSGGVNEDKVKRQTGVVRFEEIFSGTSNPSNTVITLGLYDDSEENTKRFSNEQETFYLCDIWTRCEIDISTSVDKKIQEIFSKIPYSELQINPYYVTMVWNLTKISAYNIHPVDVINRLKDNYQSIMFIAGYVLNSSEFKAFIYFKPNTKIENVNSMVEEWSIQKSSTIVHGKYLKNCFVTENRSRPGHYIIEANEINNDIKALENLIFEPEIDPSICRSTNMETMYNVFGVFEASARLCDELAYTAKNLSETNSLLTRHYKLISSYTYASGRFAAADRNYMKHDKYRDPLSLINYETPKDFIVDKIKYGNYVSSQTSYISSQFFGDIPMSGDGISNIILYEQ